jgi:hypothetical protein
MEPTRHLILKIAQALVDHPEQVAINEIDGSSTVVYELTVEKGDLGKVIGKQGRTANAMRTILGAMAGKTRKRFMLEIVDYEGAPRRLMDSKGHESQRSPRGSSEPYSWASEG